MTTAGSRVLTYPEIVGITPDDLPLTPTDQAAAVRYALRGWRGPALLEDHPTVLGGDWCTLGPLPDGRYVYAHADSRGLWVRITGGTPTSGHVPWRTARTIIAAAQPDDALFSLKV